MQQVSQFTAYRLAKQEMRNESAGEHLKPNSTERLEIFPLDRLRALGAQSPATRARTEEFVELAKRGLPQMFKKGAFAHTVRPVRTRNGPSVKPEGDSLRYATNVALGLAYVDEDVQRQILSGMSAADLARLTAVRGELSDDPGAVALAAWAAAEAGNFFAGPLFKRLSVLFASNAPVDTVDCAWTLIAALAASHLGDTSELATRAAERLMHEQGPSGLFPHKLPASANGRLRAHIGCFADQVYSIQGLARYSVARNDASALASAEACALRICELQGSSGQWWWHYDTRTGNIVEGYPVYSVHQHAMGPMALLDLREAGGTAHWRAIISGLAWLDEHPEVNKPLVAERENVIWRKVGRREPNKAVRAISALTTALTPGLRLPGLDAAFPASRIDYECRPYELGWLLYAWLSQGAVEGLRPGVAG